MGREEVDAVCLLKNDDNDDLEGDDDGELESDEDVAGEASSWGENCFKWNFISITFNMLLKCFYKSKTGVLKYDIVKQEKNKMCFYFNTY